MNNFEKRFWGNVQKTRGCWKWIGGKSQGYGRLQIGSRTDGSRRKVLAHRVSYELLVGKVPKGRELDHLCRNRACVRIDHLEVVTKRQNILRGVGMGALNARKTICKNGHAFTQKNTYQTKKGRECKTCHKAWQKKYHEKKQAKIKG